jgi:cytidine deaminase
VENASYGGSICAERSAILKAVSDRGHLHIEAMMVVTDASPPWSPCGFCRQTIAEFGSNLMVYMANLKGELIALSFSELFPQGFSKDQLP